jgi:hypothetical protein
MCAPTCGQVIALSVSSLSCHRRLWRHVPYHGSFAQVRGCHACEAAQVGFRVFIVPALTFGVPDNALCLKTFTAQARASCA